MIKPSDFRLPGGRSGVLLIHGLTGTPTEMRFVAKGLNRNGFTVHGMQLAGHCGDEEDLLKTGWRDWYQSGATPLIACVAKWTHAFVAGLSMGALLALKLAADRPDQVDGLGLYGRVRLRRLDDPVDRPAVVPAAAGLRTRFRLEAALP
jgi:carboxylesterase